MNQKQIGIIIIIAVADAINDSSSQAIKELKEPGINVYLMTGDNERTANERRFIGCCQGHQVEQDDDGKDKAEHVLGFVL